jgi:hypothetical protein
MLALALLGILMGLPRFMNTLSGWHKGTAWVLLPLIILSPLTGLFLAYRITFADPPVKATGNPVKLTEAIVKVGEKYDLSSIIWLRPQGGGLIARVNDGGEFKTMRVTSDGLFVSPRTLPRLLHEGTFSSLMAIANSITALAMMLLMVTGLWIWAKRKFRKKKR